MLKCYIYFLGLCLFLCTISLNAMSQYFYKDLWNAQQVIKELSVLKSQRIRTISIKSFEANGEPSEGFFCEKTLDKNYSFSETVTRSDVTDQSLLTSFFNDKGLLLKTTDSTATSISSSEYKYDDHGRIIAIESYTRAGDETNAINEIHEYHYNDAGNLEKMTIKKGASPARIINFIVDDKGNVIDEQETLNGVNGKKYLYYYDDQGDLTDVVHYNERAKKLLPDYMYEYSQQGQIKQMISTQEGGSNYFIWQYTYSDNGLKESEKCLSKEKKLLGSVEYSYK